MEKEEIEWEKFLENKKLTTNKRRAKDDQTCNIQPPNKRRCDERYTRKGIECKQVDLDKQGGRNQNPRVTGVLVKGGKRNKGTPSMTVRDIADHFKKIKDRRIKTKKLPSKGGTVENLSSEKGEK